MTPNSASPDREDLESVDMDQAQVWTARKATLGVLEGP